MIVRFHFVYLKMQLCNFIFLSFLLMIADGFTVQGPSGPLVVPLGASVLLPCSVDSLSSMEDLEVQWRRSDSETLVHLFQDGDVRPEVQQQEYHDRAHFFTENIKHGNFSLLLENVRAEDEGEYTCKVYSGQDSVKIVVEVKCERLIVSGSNGSISAYEGEDVTLSCSVDSRIPPEEIEEVSWKKTDKDGDLLVLLYQDNEAQPESSDERYRGRVEFFTDEIHRGNFSLRLKRVRTEDKGVYMCKVFAGELSANTTVVLEQLGFSALHIMVLILCITACGSALLICCLIYCRPNTGFIVEGSYGPVSLGGSAVLPCFIDPHLLKNNLKVEWRRSDSQSSVCVYPEVQKQEYHDRAHFFTEDIKHGNFSLLLENVRAEDEGEYTCKVYSGWRCVFSVRVTLTYDYDSDSDSESVSGFFVEYSCDLVVPLGASVILPYYKHKHEPEEDLEVQWRRSDSETLVHLFQDGDIRPEVQQQEYHDRAHFFTEDIKHGNFSLLLENVRAEDKGKYTCKVYSGQDSVFSVRVTLIQRQLGSVLRLQMFLVFCPNIIMIFAFVLWGVSEGSVSESVCCSALYILRPLMLLWAAPYINDFKGKMKTLIFNYSHVAEYFVLTAVVYSALLTITSQKLLNYVGFERVLIIILYVIMFLCCFSKSVYILAAQIGNSEGLIIDIFDIVADLTFEILPTLQFILLFYTFASARGGIIIVAVLPVLLTMANERMFYKCYRFGWSREVIRSVWLIVTLVLNAVMITLYIFTLEDKTDPVGWACVMVFLQILWTVVRFTDRSFSILFSFSLGFHRFISLYVFGSVGVVLISAVALMTELILKTVNGERAVMDLRFIVFPSECFFIMSLLISGQLESKIKKCLQSCQKRMKPKQTSADRSQQNQNQQRAAASEETPATESNQNQNSAECHEMNSLLKTEDQKAGGSEETQPDSVISQT